MCEKFILVWGKNYMKEIDRIIFGGCLVLIIVYFLRVMGENIEMVLGRIFRRIF